MAVETVKEISSGEEGALLIVKPKKVKLEKEENVNFINIETQFAIQWSSPRIVFNIKYRN